ncbi:hypothetical protein BJ138DRAFT_975012, partial [Hygrophoropsis aurantiaca]
QFSSDEHPQYKTHLSYVRSHPVVPVLLSDTVPRLHRSVVEDEKWYRLMLILFKPWRNLEDLLGGAQSWQEAFDNFSFSQESRVIMSNMNVENECKDARDHAR